MLHRTTAKLAIAAAIIPLLLACSDDDSDEKPYLEFVGGGFVFNYRLAIADYGFVAKVLRKLPADSIIEARFENPEGGEPFVVAQATRRNRTHYVFRTPPVQGVEANRDYRVELLLLDAAAGRVLASYEKTYRSDVGQEMLPDSPTVVGPGHHPNPDREAPKSKTEQSVN